MTRGKSFISVLICLLLMSGCTQSDHRGRSDYFAEPSSSKMVMPSAPGDTPSQATAGQSEETRRYIAMRHNVLVETTEADLRKAWESVGEFCEKAHCEILASAIRQNTDSPPSASLSLRIVPEETKQLIEQLGKSGNIVEHKTASEDKTATVIDVEAKLKNMTELRDRLRQLLSSSEGRLKDIVEVERELSKAQSELDSLQMRRKALANETEKVAFDIYFQSRKSVAETGTFAPIARAFREAGHVLAESIAAAVTFVVAVIPWLIIFVPGLWLLIKGIKKLRGKRTAKTSE